MSEKVKLKVGDVVFLNSEPNVYLTVEFVANDKVELAYYDSTDRIFKHAKIAPEALTLVKSSE